MFLERRISKVENAGSITDNYGKRWILSPTAILHIQLSDQSLNVIVPEIPYYKEPVYVKSPLLKQVIASALDSATFFQLNNKDEWMLADGQRAPESATDFIKLYGTNVPDLRGVFLPGRNYSRTDEYRNSDGDVKNDTPQKDTLESHHHGMN